MKKILLVSEDPNRLNNLYSLAKQVHLEGRIATGALSAKIVLQENPDIKCVIIAEPIMEERWLVVAQIKALAGRELKIIYLHLRHNSTVKDSEDNCTILSEDDHQELLRELAPFQ